MYSKMKISTSTTDYSTKVIQAEQLLHDADKIVIGIGSGLSAAGGLNYGTPELVHKWHPEYAELGYKSLMEILQLHWWYNHEDPERYWGFWAKHIWHIRYESEATKPYHDLFSLMQDKDYFICTTNVESQCEKANFPSEKIFAMQGNYAFFQCVKPCSQSIYENRDMIEQMVSHMPTPLTIRTEDIPTCPNCGAPLVPNLRSDMTFVEAPHMKNLSAYEHYLSDCTRQKVVFLELGVGYNTPSIIRFPFEKLTHQISDAHLIRINSAAASVPEEIENKSICIADDLGKVLRELRVLQEKRG